MATSKDSSNFVLRNIGMKTVWLGAGHCISPKDFPTTPNFPSKHPQLAVTKQSSHPWSRKLFPFVLKKKQLPQINAGHTVIFEKTLRQHHTPLKIQGRNFILNFHSAAVTLHPYYNITETKKKSQEKIKLDVRAFYSSHICYTCPVDIVKGVCSHVMCPVDISGLACLHPIPPHPYLPLLRPSPQHPPN